MWIRELGMVNYNLSMDKIIMGDLENATCINTIILLKKRQYIMPWKKKKYPIFLLIKMMWETYFLEKYRCYVKGKGKLFEKQYSLLSNVYVNRP